MSEETVDLEVQYAGLWHSVNDGFRFRLAADSLGETSVTLKRIEAESPFYDGTYQVHATRGNITETVVVRATGADNIDVSDKLEMLIKWFTQPSFRIRKTFGADRTTWDCYTAEYSIDRSHVMIHNRMAVAKFSVPRLPQETREVLS